MNTLEKLLQPTGNRPAGVAAVNMRAISRFQRALLVIDGTVTKFIEAYTQEPLHIERIAHEIRELDAPYPAIGADIGASVAHRVVVIQGKYSRKPYVYAVSQVVMDRLPREMCERLEQQGEGIGRIIDDMRLETRREVLWFGKEKLDRLPEGLPRNLSGDFVSREYIILRDDKPIAVINEKFPYEGDTAPSHH